jgi:hypothetical protein
VFDNEELKQITNSLILISYLGRTTADGAPAGASLIDTHLVSHPELDGNTVIITSGLYAGQSATINGTTLAGTVVPNPAFGGQIAAGTDFVIVGIRPGAGGGGLALTPFNGTYSLPDGVAEQTALTIALVAAAKINTILLDFSNLTQNCTIRCKTLVDGINSRTFETMNWTTGMDPVVYLTEVTTSANVEVTIQSRVAEGAARDIYYGYVLEA